MAASRCPVRAPVNRHPRPDGVRVGPPDQRRELAAAGRTDAAAAPRQVGQRGQGREQHVVALVRADRRDAEQLAAVGGARRGGRGVGPGPGHLHAGGVQRVVVEQPGPAPLARGQHRRGRRQHRALTGTGRRGPLAERHVQQHHHAQPRGRGDQHVGGRRGDQPVDQDDRAGGQSGEDPGQRRTRRRVRRRPRPGDRVLVHRPPGAGQPVADAPVVGVAPARPVRVVDAVRHDGVHGPHSARS